MAKNGNTNMNTVADYFILCLYSHDASGQQLKMSVLEHLASENHISMTLSC